MNDAQIEMLVEAMRRRDAERIAAARSWWMNGPYKLVRGLLIAFALLLISVLVVVGMLVIGRMA